MVKLNQNTNILIVGLGLLGGSYAMALKRKNYKVTAITKDQESIDYALDNGLIDKGYTTVAKDVIQSADLIIFALYPTVFLEWIKQYKDLIKDGTVLTDVTGVKQCIVDEIQNLLPETVEFISAHPMAGREASGIQNASSAIFSDANYIVVPTDKNSEEACSLCESLGRELGFKRISRLSPKKHDEMIAYLSQLTHCIAVSLMCSSDDENLVKYTGDSFRDLTRIAKINDEMWSELFLMNKDALLTEINNFSLQLDKIRTHLIKNDREGLREMMRTSTERRKYFDK